jgi:hypothetical protein
MVGSGGLGRRPSVSSELDWDCAMALKFPRRWPWSPLPEPPDPRTFAPSAIMLASEGRRIAGSAVEFAAQMALKAEAPVHVFFIARIWGSAFGMPHPGLMPTKREWQVQRDLAAEAVDRLKRRGVEATGQVVSSRNAGKRILAEAKRRRPRPSSCRHLRRATGSSPILSGTKSPIGYVARPGRRSIW